VAKTLIESEVNTLAVSKEKKKRSLQRMPEWLKKSQAVFLLNILARRCTLDAMRAKIRESGGEFHILKNTLARRAFSNSGMDLLQICL